jgi:hypothetical protein
MIRYFEVAVKFTLISEFSMVTFSQEAIKYVIDKFFDYDQLTQMVLIDFIHEITQKNWA